MYKETDLESLAFQLLLEFHGEALSEAILSFLHVSEGVMIEGFKENFGTVLLGKIKN